MVRPQMSWAVTGFAPGIFSATHWDRPDHARPNDKPDPVQRARVAACCMPAFKAVGVIITDAELMTGYRTLGSRLQGHPTTHPARGSTSPVGRWAKGSATAVGVALGRQVPRAIAPFSRMVCCAVDTSENRRGVGVGGHWTRPPYYELTNFTVHRRCQTGWVSADPPNSAGILAAYAKTRRSLWRPRHQPSTATTLDEIGPRRCRTREGATTATDGDRGKTIKGTRIQRSRRPGRLARQKAPPSRHGRYRRALAELGNRR